MAKLEGIYSALLTPFLEDETIDRRGIGPLVDFQVRLGVDGLYVGGSSGEAMLQSLEERAACLADVAAAADGRFDLIAHVGTIATKDALQLSEHAAKSGYQAISAIPPFYYDFSRSEVMAHYRALADASSLPLIVYNFPARTSGFTLPELIDLLSHSNIIGIKHTSSDMFLLECIRHAVPEALVYNGYDEMCLAGFAMGAQGAIGTTYNFMGDVFVALRTAMAEGRIGEARKLQTMANRVIQVLIKVGVMPGSKALLEIMGVVCGPSRRPFQKMESLDRAALRDAIAPVLAWRDDSAGANRG
ncbi:N-acetylneuraminate lyase [Phyllobacterium salinisoli]|uniref:N-acetylneuraminate lyase n=1 Tax=Phyllobacterium salinisoli TaxID=1899321 RepID=A0A368JYB3_9HYPH|nr:N-acetylneuraminate lyase [Phyllobacterium salinisoli]RCS22138.1 N-acetylneuraminate lyase [Phyllobacterium salinisoli]